MSTHQLQLIEDYNNATYSKPSWGGIFAFGGSGFLFFGLFLISGSILITLLVAILASVVLMFINESMKTSIDKKFFNNSDNHTHDDACDTCGNPNLFGMEDSYAHPEQYVCRYKTGEIRKY
jgi:hypothetical protein